MHALAKLGEHDAWPFAVEQLVAELALEHLDGAGEGGLRDMAFFSGAREVARPDHRQEISHLMHFHDLLHHLPRVVSQRDDCGSASLRYFNRFHNRVDFTAIYADVAKRSVVERRQDDPCRAALPPRQKAAHHVESQAGARAARGPYWRRGSRGFGRCLCQGNKCDHAGECHGTQLLCLPWMSAVAICQCRLRASISCSTTSRLPG